MYRRCFSPISVHITWVWWNRYVSFNQCSNLHRLHNCLYFVEGRPPGRVQDTSFPTFWWFFLNAWVGQSKIVSFAYIPKYFCLIGALPALPRLASYGVLWSEQGHFRGQCPCGPTSGSAHGANLWLLAALFGSISALHFPEITCTLVWHLYPLICCWNVILYCCFLCSGW